jgi:hypothetical protein
MSRFYSIYETRGKPCPRQQCFDYRLPANIEPGRPAYLSSRNMP